MRLLEARDLSDLMKAQPYPCISIYMGLGTSPLERRGAETRLRSLVKAADLVLDASAPARTKPFLLEPFTARAVRSLEILPEGVEGVALFRSFGTAGIYPIDHHVPEYMAVTDSFHLKPLLPVIQGHDTYYAVVLQQRQIRLYRGNEHRLALVASYAAPDDEAPAFEAPHKPGRDRGAPRGRVGRYVVHRMPAASRVEDFVRRSEKAMREIIGTRRAPVVLVGSPLMRRYFRSSCGHALLLREEVAATLSAHEERAIHSLTWPIARRAIARKSEQVTSAFKRLHGSAHASDDLQAIAKEALHGRVSDLLISKDDRVFGRLNRAGGHVIPLAPEADVVGDDVLCDIAQEVLLRGGSAHVLPKNEMPTRSPIAATFRW